jgi:hypothetical protein
MRRNRKLLSIIVIVGVIAAGIVWYINPFAKTEIVLLKHMTEWRGEDSTLSEIYLIKHLPSTSDELKRMIFEWNRNSAYNGDYHRLFIKEHDNNMFYSVDYSSSKATRSDLDNIDFLATSYRIRSVNGKWYSETKMRVGDVWYYKE